jgi:hypothetical protein
LLFYESAKAIAVCEAEKETFVLLVVAACFWNGECAVLLLVRRRLRKATLWVGDRFVLQLAS